MFKTESYKQGVVVSTIFNLLAKTIGFVQTLAIAFYFGAQLETDIYLFFYGAALLFAGFINSLDQAVIIPEAIRLKTQASVDEATKFLNCFLYIYVAIAVVLLTIFFSFPIPIASVISKYDHITLSQHFYLVTGAFSLTMLVVLTTFLSNILLAFRYFSIPIIITIVNGLISLTFLIFFKDVLNIFSIILGLIVGYSINISAVLLLIRRKLGWRFTWDFHSLRKLSLKKIMYAQLGNFTTLLCSYIPFYLLTGFAGGIVTNINYAMRTADIPNQVVVAQLSSIVGIKFNEQLADRNPVGFSRSFETYSIAALSLLIPLSIFLSFNSSDFIRIIYERGNFNNDSVVETSMAFSILILNVPLYAMNAFVARAFIATQRLDISVLYQLGMNLGYIILIYLCMKLMGPIGFPVASVTIYLLNFFLAYYILRKLCREINYRVVIVHMMKTLVITLAAAGVSFFVMKQLGLVGVSKFILSGFCYVAAFLPLALSFKIMPGLNLMFSSARVNLKFRF